MAVGIAAARSALREGGVPIAAVLVGPDGRTVVGVNQRLQRGSLILHAEMDAIEKWGRARVTDLTSSVLYTTRRPCVMCVGAILFYAIPRVVAADRRVLEEPDWALLRAGVRVDATDDAASNRIMRTFRSRSPELWAEDSGARC